MSRRTVAWITGFCLIAFVLSGLPAIAQDEKEPSKDDKKELEKEAKDRIDEFKAELKAKGRKITEMDIVSALENLGEMQHPKIFIFLVGQLKSPSPDVRREAARQIAKYEKDVKAATTLLNAAKKEKDPKTASTFLQCAADVGVRGLGKDLVKFFHNKDLDVAGAAVKACGTLKSKDTIQPLISLVRELEEIQEDRAHQQGVPNIPGTGYGSSYGENPMLKRKNALLPLGQGALQDITGERFNKGAEWEQWWRKNGRKWKEPE